jgi:hypothetical protein
MIKYLIVFLFIIFIGGCSYSPVTKYSDGIINKRVFVVSDISAMDPENSVIVKDAIYNTLSVKFNSKIVPSKDSQIDFKLKFSSILFSNIQYDSLGFISVKRAKVVLDTTIFMKEINKTINFKTDGIYDFSVADDILTDSDRFIAIKNASAKAIDSMIAKLSILNLIKEN